MERSDANARGPQPLRGRTVAFLEARRAADFARLIERAGGIAYVAPPLREMPVEDDREILGWLERLAGGQFDTVIFLTGGGSETLLQRAEQHGRLAAVLDALGRARVVARGPKPAHVLRRYAVPVSFVPPEPNTSDELLRGIADWDLAGKAVGLQLYGGTSPYLERLRTGLAALGARVDEVSPYRWEGPVDVGPVRDLIDACAGGRIDALAVLSSSQIHNLFDLAVEYGRGAALRDALNQPGVLVAAVGPVTAEAIVAHGVRVDLQPEHPKMGHLVKALGEAFSASAGVDRAMR